MVLKNLKGKHNLTVLASERGANSPYRKSANENQVRERVFDEVIRKWVSPGKGTARSNSDF